MSIPSSREMYRTRCSGKVPLHVVSSENVVTAQPGEILGDDHVDLPGLNISDHSLKIRAVEVCPAPSIIHIGIKDA